MTDTKTSIEDNSEVLVYVEGQKSAVEEKPSVISKSSTFFSSEVDESIDNLLLQATTSRQREFKKSIVHYLKLISKYWEFLSRGEKWLSENQDQIQLVASKLLEMDIVITKLYQKLKENDDVDDQIEKIYTTVKKSFFPNKQKCKLPQNSNLIFSQNEDSHQKEQSQQPAKSPLKKLTTSIEITIEKTKAKLKRNKKVTPVAAAISKIHKPKYDVKFTKIYQECSKFLLLVAFLFMLFCGIPFVDYNTALPSWKNMKERMELVYTYKFRQAVTLEMASSITLWHYQTAGLWQEYHSWIWKENIQGMISDAKHLHNQFEYKYRYRVEGINTLEMDKKFFRKEENNTETSQNQQNALQFYDSIFALADSCIQKQDGRSECLNLLDHFTDEFFSNSAEEILEIEKKLVVSLNFGDRVLIAYIAFVTIMVIICFVFAFYTKNKLKNKQEMIENLITILPEPYCKSMQMGCLQLAEHIRSNAFIDSDGFIEQSTKPTRDKINQYCQNLKAQLKGSEFIKFDNFFVQGSIVKKMVFKIIIVLIAAIYLFSYKWSIQKVPSGENLTKLYKEYQYITEFDINQLRAFSKLVKLMKPVKSTESIDREAFEAGVQNALEYSIILKQNLIKFRSIHHFNRAQHLTSASYRESYYSYFYEDDVCSRIYSSSTDVSRCKLVFDRDAEDRTGNEFGNSKFSYENMLEKFSQVQNLLGLDLKSAVYVQGNVSDSMLRIQILRVLKGRSFGDQCKLNGNVKENYYKIIYKSFLHNFLFLMTEFVCILDYFTSGICRRISQMLAKNFWYPEGDFNPFISVHLIKYASFAILIALIYFSFYTANQQLKANVSEGYIYLKLAQYYPNSVWEKLNLKKKIKEV